MNGQWRCNKHPGELDLLEAMSAEELANCVGRSQHPFFPSKNSPIFGVTDADQLTREIDRIAPFGSPVPGQLRDLIADASSRKQTVYGVFIAESNTAPAIVTLPNGVPVSTLWTDMGIASCICWRRRITSPDKPCVLHFYHDPAGTLPPHQHAA